MSRKPSYLFSFLTIGLLVGLIALNSLVVGVDVASGSNNVIILTAAASSLDSRSSDILFPGNKLKKGSSTRCQKWYHL